MNASIMEYFICSTKVIARDIRGGKNIPLLDKNILFFIMRETIKLITHNLFNLGNRVLSRVEVNCNVVVII